MIVNIMVIKIITVKLTIVKLMNIILIYENIVKFDRGKVNVIDVTGLTKYNEKMGEKNVY